jgi:hypothetical protein
MPGFTARFGSLFTTMHCALHNKEAGYGRSKCQQRDGCRDFWYIEGVYAEFEMPDIPKED